MCKKTITTISKFSDWFEGSDKEIISSFANIMNCYPNPKLHYQPDSSKREDYKIVESIPDKLNWSDPTTL